MRLTKRQLIERLKELGWKEMNSEHPGSDWYMLPPSELIQKIGNGDFHIWEAKRLQNSFSDNKILEDETD